jgi:hypothetical protein
VIDEWDDFQIERENLQEKIHIEKSFDELVEMDLISKGLPIKQKTIKMEDLSNMSERRIEIRLSKDYNVAVVEVSGIQSTQEFNSESEWAKNEAQSILDSYGSTPTYAKPNEYVKAHQETKAPANGVYTLAHITTKYLKGRQFEFALKGLNEGRINLDALNNSTGWQESNAIVFPKK